MVRKSIVIFLVSVIIFSSLAFAAIKLQTQSISNAVYSGDMANGYGNYGTIYFVNENDTIQYGILSENDGTRSYIPMDSGLGNLRLIFSGNIQKYQIYTAGTINLTYNNGSGSTSKILNIPYIYMAPGNLSYSLYFDKDGNYYSIPVPNSPPVLETIGNKSTNENQTLTFTINASDADGDNLTYNATGLPAGAVFNTSTRLFNWTPLFNQSGNYPVTFYVFDAVSNDSETINITVNNVPTAPLLSLQSPLNTTYARNNLSLNYTVQSNGTDIGSCWYVLDSIQSALINCSNRTIVVNDGSHNLTVYANDTFNSTSFVGVRFTADTTAPNITNTTTQPLLPITINGSSNITINFSSSEFPINVSFNIYNSTGWLVSSTTIQVANSSMLPIIYTIPTLPNGNYTLNMTATDSAGNSYTTTLGTFTIVTVDNVFPTLNLQLPLNTTYTTRNVSLNYSAGDDNNLSVCWYNLNGGANTTLASCANITFLAAEGSNTLIVYVNDSSGNKNQTNVSFFVDSIVPAIAFALPTSSGNLSQTWIYANASASDANLGTVVIRLYNSSGLVGSMNASSYNFTNLTGGVYYLNASVSDIAGNQNTTETRTIILDATKPVISLVASDFVEYGYGNVSVTWLVSDANPNISYLNVSYPNGSLLGSFNQNITLSTANLTQKGNYTLVVYAQDLFNNTNVSTKTLVVQDTLGPVVNILNPANNSTHASNTIDLNYSVYDPSGVTRCAYKLDNLSLIVLSNCSNTTLIVGSGLHNITIYANDSLNNSNMSIANFNIRVGRMVTGYVFDQNNNTVGGVAITFTRDGINYGNILSTVNGSYLINLSAGYYNITASKTGYLQYAGNVTVLDSDIVYKNITLVQQNSSLAGYVKDINGSAIFNATVIVGNLNASTDAGGYFAVSVVPGIYNLTASKSGFLNQSITNLVVYAGQNTSINFVLVPENFTFTNGTGNISGTVKDVLNTLLNASLRFSGSTEYNTTSLNGAYQALNVSNGTYVAYINGSCYLPQTVTNIFVDANRTSLYNFLLFRVPARISGQIMDSFDNASIVNATVILTSNNFVVAVNQTDANGSYLFDTFDGLYNMSISKNGYVIKTIQITALCGDAIYNVSIIPTGNLSGTITNGNSALVELKQSGQTVISTAADANGFYNLTTPVGTYSLVATRSGYDTYTNTVTIGKNNTSFSFTLVASVVPPAPVSGGSGFGGGGSSAGTSIFVTETNKQSVEWSYMSAGSYSVLFKVIDVPIVGVKFDLNKSVSNGKIYIILLGSNPVIDNLSNVYKYIEIKTENLKPENIKNVKISFRVKKSWLNITGTEKNDIFLYRYDDGWAKLSTQNTKNDTDYEYYEVQSPGFSYFAIAGEQKTRNQTNQTIPSIPRPADNQTANKTGAAITGAAVSEAGPLIVGIILIIIILLIIVYLSIKSSKNEKKQNEE